MKRTISVDSEGSSPPAVLSTGISEDFSRATLTSPIRRTVSADGPSGELPPSSRRRTEKKSSDGAAPWLSVSREGAQHSAPLISAAPAGLAGRQPRSREEATTGYSEAEKPDECAIPPGCKRARRSPTPEREEFVAASAAASCKAAAAAAGSPLNALQKFVFTDAAARTAEPGVEPETEPAVAEKSISPARKKQSSITHERQGSFSPASSLLQASSRRTARSPFHEDTPFNLMEKIWHT
eukprot:gnl/TRDRNA2_/TRDRNA2_135326_c0_seq2.p1 gnl/TRDRNA2_/TRDRNA2_135326_c0~~gnl/TRDRNA2_/TRDRNA2_135326_c0_seq2.p1  ORF type:complete len:239 (+),score=37.80 gnl/TRDRNA2_/TRDRNA2_135326_c0_seq2:34-750(+)